MAYPPPAVRRTPLDTEEMVRAVANFTPLVAEQLVANGRFRVGADSPELVELFQTVAGRVGELLRRPVVSYANGRYMVITFGEEEASGPRGPGPGAFAG